MKSKEFDIRSGVVRQLLSEGIVRGDIRHEITLDTSSSGGRGDIIVLQDREIIGIELKSGSDILDNAEKQMADYRLSFDRVGLICDKIHEEKIRRVSWMYRIFYCHDTRATVQTYGAGWEPAKILPKYSALYESGGTNIPYMASLLWKKEIDGVMHKLDMKTGTRCRSINRLKEDARLSELRPLVISALRSRVLSKWEQSFWTKFDKEAA